MKSATHLLEAKRTDKVAFRLEKRIIQQHWARAASVGREPALVLEFSSEPPLRVIVLPYDP